jgi:glycerate-2-kinase
MELAAQVAVCWRHWPAPPTLLVLDDVPGDVVGAIAEKPTVGERASGASANAAEFGIFAANDEPVNLASREIAARTAAIAVPIRAMASHDSPRQSLISA